MIQKAMNWYMLKSRYAQKQKRTNVFFIQISCTKIISLKNGDAIVVIGFMYLVIDYKIYIIEAVTFLKYQLTENNIVGSLL